MTPPPATKGKADGLVLATGQAATIQAALLDAWIEILVGGPYKDHNYGHAALRVVTTKDEHVYDYGRYAGATGTFGASGPGIMRVWTSFQAYIANENRTDRTTTGFTYNTTTQQAEKINSYYAALTAAAQLRKGGIPGTMTEYKLNQDYFALGPNCVTMTMDGTRLALPLLEKDAAKFNDGRGLQWSEKTAAKLEGWPSRVFMPADLKEMLQAGGGKKPDEVKTYKK